MKNYDKSINIQHIFNNMQGVWIIDRKFKPCDSSSLPAVAGQATIKSSQGNRLIYFEEIELRWPNGRKSGAYQSYVYSLQNDVITKFQNYASLDNLPCLSTSSKMFDLEFLPLTQNSKTTLAIGVFHCHHDIYEARFIFESANKFSIEYKVTGPHKDYQIFTKYTKYISKY